MEIWFIRHGESTANAKGLVQGRGDYPLSDQGRRQAEAVARPVIAFTPERIYASPLARALETAHIIGRPLQLTPEVLDDLIEYDLGAFEGLTPAEIETRYPHVPEGLKNRVPFHQLAPGAETDDQAALRAERALDSITAAGLARVIVVSHLGILERTFKIMAARRRLRDYDRPAKDYLKNCSISRFELTGDHGRAIIVNDVSHLDGPA